MDKASVDTTTTAASEKSGYQPKVEHFENFDDEAVGGFEGEGEEGDRREDFGILEFMTDAELLDYANELEVTIRYMEVENDVFLFFVNEHCPHVLENLEQMISQATQLALKQAPLGTLKEVEPQSDSSEGSLPQKSVVLMEQMPKIANLITGRGPKVSVTTKIEMVTKKIENAIALHDEFTKKALRTKRNLKAELEEFNIRESDLKYAKNQFEFNVIVSGVEKLTGRIPAEKWLRYMDEWIRQAMLSMEKLRLRISSLKSQYKKLSTNYYQRKELSATVHAVDFDQLEIANKHLLLKIDQKQLYLIELKKMNGGANLVLSRHKKVLLSQQMEFNKLVKDIESNERLIESLDEEYFKIEAERDFAREKFENFKKFKSEHRVPDIVDYVVLKKEIDEINKNIKIWQRRKNIQEISLNASLREMKHITGSRVIDPSWIEDPMTEEELFEFII
ncbi:unnamed protein product [Phyllotreta striolata]|uniref:Cilia- and flagella-associated protein 263 n=1 Tax=Phyllotreta striolata TaxID=444603 RepID=A0A9N9XJP4_PHYSR|nr:unnamed protein product [Phyllotreta striolata]